VSEGARYDEGLRPLAPQRTADSACRCLPKHRPLAFFAPFAMDKIANARSISCRVRFRTTSS